MSRGLTGMIGVLVERGGIVGHAGLRKSQRRTYAAQEIDIAINAFLGHHAIGFAGGVTPHTSTAQRAKRAVTSSLTRYTYAIQCG